MSEETVVKNRAPRTIFVGRRKTSIARVKIVDGEGIITINGKPVEQYLPVVRKILHAIHPLDTASVSKKVNVSVNVAGGGIDGQAGAIRMGIARALIGKDASLRPILKSNGMLRRDPRMVERKKYGLRKARRGTQFSKR